jgi:hypothetical protein
MDNLKKPSARWLIVIERASKPFLVILGLVVTIVLQCCQLSLTRKVEETRGDRQEMEQAINLIRYLSDPNPKISGLARGVVLNLRNEKLKSEIIGFLYDTTPDSSAKHRFIGILGNQQTSFPIEELTRLAGKSTNADEHSRLLQARDQVLIRSRKTFMENLRHAMTFVEFGDAKDAADKFRKISYLLAESGGDSTKIRLADAFYDLGNLEEASKQYYEAAKAIEGKKNRN